MQIAMISKAMIKFGSKFQAQIPLYFHRKVEKIETCAGISQKLREGPPFFQLSHFGYYFVFS